MKKVTKPAKKEQATYYSDFDGVCFGDFEPPVQLNVSFSYGSKYDGTDISLHLTEAEITPILDIIKKNISADFKDSVRKLIKCQEESYEESMQMRDWDYCDKLSNTLWFWRDLLGLTNDIE